MKPIHIGQLEVMPHGDLVAVLHREPVMHPITHTFTGSFESKPYWTQLTPARARELANAMEAVAEFLEACDRAKGAST